MTQNLDDKVRRVTDPMGNSLDISLAVRNITATDIDGTGNVRLTWSPPPASGIGLSIEYDYHVELRKGTPFPADPNDETMPDASMQAVVESFSPNYQLKIFSHDKTSGNIASIIIIEDIVKGGPPRGRRFFAWLRRLWGYSSS